jgi:hypothetical protein
MWRAAYRVEDLALRVAEISATAVATVSTTTGLQNASSPMLM